MPVPYIVKLSPNSMIREAPIAGIRCIVEAARLFEVVAADRHISNHFVSLPSL